MLNKHGSSLKKMKLVYKNRANSKEIWSPTNDHIKKMLNSNKSAGYLIRKSTPVPNSSSEGKYSY